MPEVLLSFKEGLFTSLVLCLWNKAAAFSRCGGFCIVLLLKFETDCTAEDREFDSWWWKVREWTNYLTWQIPSLSYIIESCLTKYFFSVMLSLFSCFMLQLVVSEILSNCAIFVTVTNEDWKTFYNIRQFIFLFNLSMGWSTPTMSNMVSH